MANRRKRSPRRDRKNKLSALDIYDEFADDSPNHFVEVESKLSKEETLVVAARYQESEQRYLGLGEKEGSNGTKIEGHIASPSGPSGHPTQDITYIEKIDSAGAQGEELIGDDKGTKKERIGNDKGTKKELRNAAESAVKSSLSASLELNRTIKELKEDDKGTKKELETSEAQSKPIGRLLEPSGPASSQIGGDKGTNKGLRVHPIGGDKGTKKELKGDDKGTGHEGVGHLKGTLKELHKGRIGNDKETKSTDESNPNPIDINTVFRLSPQKKSLMRFLFETCRNHGSRTTPALISSELSAAAGTTAKAIRIRIKELKKSGFIEIHDSKRGRGGYQIFRLPEQVYTILTAYFSKDQRSAEPSVSNDKGTNLELQRELHKELRSSSSSSSNNYITTTKTGASSDSEKRPRNAIPEDWANIHIPEYLSAQSYSQTHIKQVYDSVLKHEYTLSAEDVQNSLYEAAFDLENGHATAYRGPIPLIQGILRKGEPYVSPHLLKKEQEQMMLIKKARDEQKRLEEFKVDEDVKIRAERYVQNLSDAQKLEIQPEGPLAKVGDATYTLLIQKAVAVKIRSGEIEA